MNSFNLNVMGVPVGVKYANTPISDKDIVVVYEEKDDNRTHFKIKANPTQWPDVAIRSIARSVFDDMLLRKFIKPGEQTYISMEDGNV